MVRVRRAAGNTLRSREDALMAGMLNRILTAVELTRIAAGFGAVCDIWFVTVLVHLGWRNQIVDWSFEGVLLDLAGSLMVAIGLFGYGSVLNDLLDVRHDRAFSPDRPLPAGDIQITQAVIGLVGLLMVAILGAMLLGKDSVFLTMIVAAALMFYNAAGRFIPPVGIVTVGLVYAVSMLIPSYKMPLLLAIWLIMSHVMILALLIHLLEDKRPRISPRGFLGILMGWCCCSAVVLLVRPMRGLPLWPAHDSSLDLMWPLGATVLMAIIGWWKIRTAGTGHRASERRKRYGAAWHAAYASAWFAALGMCIPAAAFLIPGFIAFAVTTIVRELSGLGPGRLQFR